MRLLWGIIIGVIAVLVIGGIFLSNAVVHWLQHWDDGGNVQPPKKG